MARAIAAAATVGLATFWSELSPAVAFTHKVARGGSSFMRREHFEGRGEDSDLIDGAFLELNLDSDSSERSMLGQPGDEENDAKEYCQKIGFELSEEDKEALHDDGNRRSGRTFHGAHGWSGKGGWWSGKGGKWSDEGGNWSGKGGKWSGEGGNWNRKGGKWSGEGGNWNRQGGWSGKGGKFGGQGMSESLADTSSAARGRMPDSPLESVLEEPPALAMSQSYDFFMFINQFRMSPGGCPHENLTATRPLVFDCALARAATDFAQAKAAMPDLPDWVAKCHAAVHLATDRIKPMAVEVIRGDGEVVSVQHAWKYAITNSEVFCSRLHSPAYSRIGIGLFERSVGNQKEAVWVVLLHPQSALAKPKPDMSCYPEGAPEALHSA